MIESLAGIRAKFAAQPASLFSQFDEGDPRKLAHLSLEQQKKRARELLRQWRSSSGANKDAKLSDAQRTIAREHGFSKWSMLKAHILQIQIARDALKNGELKLRLLVLIY